MVSPDCSCTKLLFQGLLFTNIPSLDFSTILTFMLLNSLKDLKIWLFLKVHSKLLSHLHLPQKLPYIELLSSLGCMYVFLRSFYGCESWAIKKTEHQRIDAFELVCWRRLLEVSWSARISTQSILKKISSEYSLEILMLRLKLQYFGHLMWRTDSLKITLMLGKIEDRRRRGWQSENIGWHHQLDGHEFEQALGVGDGQGNLACFSPWGCKELGRTEWLNWTEDLLLMIIGVSLWGSLVTQLVKNLPAMQENWVQSLGWEDPMEKGKATHSSILAWRIPWAM